MPANPTRLELIACTILAGVVLGLGGDYFRDPGSAAVQAAVVDTNKREISQHKSTPAHYGARQEIALLKQEQRFQRDALERVLNAIEASADISTKTNELLQDIAADPKQKLMPR